MTVAREMFGKGYFSLGVSEKGTVDQTVLGAVGGNYQAITPAFLAGQQVQQPMGFGVPAAAPTPEKEEAIGSISIIQFPRVDIGADDGGGPSIPPRARAGAKRL